MQVVYNRWLQQSSKKESNDTLIVESTSLDTYSEYKASMEVNVSDFKIRDCVVETLRLPDESLEKSLLFSPQLKGINAYFGAGKAIISALPDNPAIVDLILETVTAVIQSETYLYKERGLAKSHDEYDKYWDNMFKDSCYYYSNLSRANKRFMQHIQPKYRTSHLFSRQRVVTIYQIGQDSYRIYVNLSDSFHEMNIVLETKGPSHLISNITGNMLRCPDEICMETSENLNRLLHAPLLDTPHKKINKLTGGSDGCTHFGQMLIEGAKSLSCFIAARGEL